MLVQSLDMLHHACAWNVFYSGHVRGNPMGWLLGALPQHTATSHAVHTLTVKFDKAPKYVVCMFVLVLIVQQYQVCMTRV